MWCSSEGKSLRKIYTISTHKTSAKSRSITEFLKIIICEKLLFLLITTQYLSNCQLSHWSKYIPTETWNCNVENLTSWPRTTQTTVYTAANRNLTQMKGCRYRYNLPLASGTRDPANTDGVIKCRWDLVCFFRNTGIYGMWQAANKYSYRCLQSGR